MTVMGRFSYCTISSTTPACKVLPTSNVNYRPNVLSYKVAIQNNTRTQTSVKNKTNNSDLNSVHDNNYQDIFFRPNA